MILLAVVLFVAVLSFFAIQWIDRYIEEKIDLMNIQTNATEEEVFATEPLTEDVLPETEIEDLHGQLNESNLPLICDTEKVMNILLMATDTREKEAGLSDVMILVSINRETKNIVLCSFMRDLLVQYASEPKSAIAGQYGKLTAAHSYGGPQLTMATLKENYNIDVEFYAKVNFFSFVDVVDAMGGIDLELNSDEIWWINEFMKAPEIAEIFPSYSKKGISGKAGVYHLNGLQALGHARNRKIGSDWARTERQRTILAQMATQAKSLSVTEINELLNTVLPMVTTNMSKDVLKDLAWNALSFLSYDMVSTRVPLKGTYEEIDYRIIPDKKKNMSDLYEKIYGEPAPTAE